MEPQIHPEGGWNHAESVAVMTAQPLNEAGIPCVLWGSCSVALWGVERMKNTLDFVVADDLADKAMQTLLDMQPFPWTVTRCQNPANCEAWDNEAENFPSKRHLHRLPLVRDVNTRFQIFSRSEILFMPPMDKLPSAYEDSAAFAEALGPHFLLASDSSRLPPLESFWHTGVFKSGRHPIVAPMPHVVVEAEMRLYARYCQKNWKYLWGQTRAALGADRRVVDPELMSDPVL